MKKNQVIRISELTSVADIISWTLAEAVTFEIHSKASFEIGAEGPALALLRGFADRAKQIVVSCSFPVPDSNDAILRTVFATAFGFSLIRLASQIVFPSVAATKTSELKIMMGGLYVHASGLLGSGKKASLVQLDRGYAIPHPRLPATQGNSSGEDSFISPSAFLGLFPLIETSIGFQIPVPPSARAELADFLCEAFVNTEEHGTPSSDLRKRAVRAVTFEKWNYDEQSWPRRRLASDLLGFVDRVKRGTNGAALTGIFSVSVADQGDGIPRTLPALEKESREQRIVRALQSGQSRKPADGTKLRGEGFTKMLTVAHRLGGLVEIASGGVFLAIDYSLSDGKYSSLDGLEVIGISDVDCAGTAISVFLPSYDQDLNRRLL